MSCCSRGDLSVAWVELVERTSELFLVGWSGDISSWVGVIAEEGVPAAVAGPNLVDHGGHGSSTTMCLYTGEIFHFAFGFKFCPRHTNTFIL